MKGSLRFFSIVVAALGTGVAPQAAHAANKADPDSLCSVSDWLRDTVAETCTPGEKVIFLPESFGNEQLPVLFAAVNCDLQHAVVWTKGAVTCVYRPIKSSHSDSDDADQDAQQ